MSDATLFPANAAPESAHDRAQEAQMDAHEKMQDAHEDKPAAQELTAEEAKAKREEIEAREKAEKQAAERAAKKLEEIASFWVKAQDRQRKDFLKLGKLCSDYVETALAGIAGKRKQVRANAVKAIALRLEIVQGESLDVNRAIACYQLTRLLGPSAETLAVGVLKAFLPLIDRDEATEKWNINPKHDATLRDLYNRACEGKLTGADARLEVSRALGKVSTEGQGKSDGSETATPERGSNSGASKASSKDNALEDDDFDDEEICPEAYIIPAGKDAAAAIMKILDSTSERSLVLKLLGNVIGAGDFQSLVFGLAESIKADRKRGKVWSAMLLGIESERKKLLAEQEAEKATQKPAPATEAA